MAYRVEMENRARKEYLALTPEVRGRIAEVIDGLARDPRPPGSKRLAGEDGYRVRRGHDRVLYSVDDEAKLIRIYRVGHRRDVYRKR